MNNIIVERILERDVENKARAIVKEFPTMFWGYFEKLCDEELGKAHADVDRVVRSLESDSHLIEWWDSEEGGGACRKEIDDAVEKAFGHVVRSARTLICDTMLIR